MLSQCKRAVAEYVSSSRMLGQCKRVVAEYGRIFEQCYDTSDLVCYCAMCYRGLLVDAVRDLQRTDVWQRETTTGSAFVARLVILARVVGLMTPIVWLLLATALTVTWSVVVGGSLLSRFFFFVAMLPASYVLLALAVFRWPGMLVII